MYLFAVKSFVRELARIKSNHNYDVKYPRCSFQKIYLMIKYEPAVEDTVHKKNCRYASGCSDSARQQSRTKEGKSDISPAQTWN